MCAQSCLTLCDSMDCGIYMDLIDVEYIHMVTNPMLGYNSPFIFKIIYIFILSDKYNMYLLLKIWKIQKNSLWVTY